VVRRGEGKVAGPVMWSWRRFRVEVLAASLQSVRNEVALEAAMVFYCGAGAGIGLGLVVRGVGWGKSNGWTDNNGTMDDADGEYVCLGRSDHLHIRCRQIRRMGSEG